MLIILKYHMLIFYLVIMLIIFLAALLSTFFFYLIFPTLKKSFLDYPVLRSSHTAPTPKGGGIIFALIGIIGSFERYYEQVSS